jgi:hypothetical protein
MPFQRIGRTERLASTRSLQIRNQVRSSLLPLPPVLIAGGTLSRAASLPCSLFFSDKARRLTPSASSFTGGVVSPVTSLPATAIAPTRSLPVLKSSGPAPSLCCNHVALSLSPVDLDPVDRCRSQPSSVRDRQDEQNEEDQTNHRDTRILTWKTLQSEGKNHGHQPATTFTIFVECLQERRDLFRFTLAQASRRRASASLTNLATFKKFGS